MSKAPGDDIVIVGAGDCGTRVATRLRELGFGGRVTLVGAEVEEPYERPELSKRVLAQPNGMPSQIISRSGLEVAEIMWISDARAVAIDAHEQAIELEDGRSLPFGRLVLATGSRARELPVPGGDAAHTVRTMGDAVALRGALTRDARLLVIGGGFIGLEVAATAVGRGCQVTVVEFTHELMARVVPRAVADVLRQRHAAEGVDLQLGVGVERVDLNEGLVTAQLEDGSVVEADVLVAGVGAIPNSELAATADLSISNGISVDEYLQTSHPQIFAAGDCCSLPHPLYNGDRIRLEAWRNAVAQSEVLARNLLGGREVYREVPSFWSDQYDLTVNVVGLHRAAASTVVRRRADGHEIYFGLDVGGRLLSAGAAAPERTMARDIQVAERLIAARAHPRASVLADPRTDLRALMPESAQGETSVSSST